MTRASVSRGTDIRPIADRAAVAAAAEIVATGHRRLVDASPYLPRRTADDYRPKVGWLAEQGVVLGLWRDGRLTAFMGGVRFDDFRHEGPGWFSPDWANGAADPASAFDDYRALYREVAPLWVAGGARVHALALVASAAPAIEALSLTSFGRIVMDAAAPTTAVAERCAARPAAPGVAVRRAGPDDAPTLADLNTSLAEHIGASPIFFPDPRGDDADAWRTWLTEPDAVALLAESDGRTVGYIKAQDPEDDVSDTVHDPSCLAVNGMYCDPSVRGRGVGTTLVSALAAHASAAGKSLMSVDCETHNLEAYGFWTQFFAPVAWGFERRV